MKPRETLLRAKRFTVSEKSKKVGDLEYMLHEFESMVGDLDHQIKVEEERTGIRDPGHFSYSMFAKSAAARRDKLKASIDDLRLRLEDAVRERQDAESDLERSLGHEARETDRGGSVKADLVGGHVN